MKYNAGDCISLKLTDNIFLGGFISSSQDSKYQIVLTDYRQDTPPPANYFNDCLLFTTRYEMGETSFSALDVITIDIANADQLDYIERVIHLEIPGFLSASGFQEIANIAELMAYFELGTRLRNNVILDKGSVGRSFETKCFQSISDFFQNVAPRNEFPTIKLYKKIDDSIQYWQIYGSSINPVSLVIHWGRLGETGEFIEIKDQSLNEAKEFYNTKISEKKGEGYEELQTPNRMILQFHTADGWGGVDDLAFRNEIWEHLDRFLFWTGNGSISGGDIGSGTVNLFFEAVVQDIAVNTIVQALEEKKTDRKYLIAIEKNDAIMTEDDSFGVKILYPTDYQSPFYY